MSVLSILLMCVLVWLLLISAACWWFVVSVIAAIDELEGDCRPGEVVE